jgi:hypothetical protein
LVDLTNGWSGTLQGDTQFAKDYLSIGGSVGLRKEF